MAPNGSPFTIVGLARRWFKNPRARLAADVQIPGWLLVFILDCGKSGINYAQISLRKVRISSAGKAFGSHQKTVVMRSQPKDLAFCFRSEFRTHQATSISGLAYPVRRSPRD